MTTVPVLLPNEPALMNEPPTASVEVGAVTAPAEIVKLFVVVAIESMNAHDPPEPFAVRLKSVEVATPILFPAAVAYMTSEPLLCIITPPVAPELINEPPTYSVPLGSV